MAKFYVSSTYNDLREYRSEVYRALRQMGHDAIAMEDYVAADERPLTRCLADVAKCDAYIGIIAWRRGFVPNEGNPEGRSITELEYARAGEEDLPRLIFLLSPAAPWPSDAKDPVVDNQLEPSAEGFRARLASDHLVSFFETPHQLALLVSIAIRKWETESGYTSPPPSLSDQPLPEELKVDSYIPGRELKLVYDQPWFVNAILWGFIALCLCVPMLPAILALFPAQIHLADPPGLRSIAAAALFAAFVAWVMIRPRRIWFDFESGHVTVQGLGGFGIHRPSAGALTLVTEEVKNGWRASLLYDSNTLLTTASLPSRREARSRVLNFALALNFALGMHTLDELVYSREGRRGTRKPENSHFWAGLLGATTVLITVHGYPVVRKLLDTEAVTWHRIGELSLAALPVSLWVAFFAGGIAQSILLLRPKHSQTRLRAFMLGLAVGAAVVLFLFMVP